MSATGRKLNPLRTLRARIGLIVLGVIAALALFMAQYLSDRLTTSYEEAGQAQLSAIASMWDDSFRLKHLGSPVRTQRRMNALREKNPTLHKLSLSWHDRTGGTWLVSSGHEHDPDGTKRDVTTGAVTRSESRVNPAPIDARNFRYHEVNAADGAHYAELNYPLQRFREGRRQIVGALELHYDLKTLDAALAADKRTLTFASILAAATAALLINFLLARAVLSPLDRLRAATRRIGAGEVTTRLHWKRTDEIGLLAGDFDRMAGQLESVRGHLEELALMDPLTGLLNHRAFQERMSQELRRAEREGYSVSIVALDVDHFKEINDRWGHAAGDEALTMLARSIRAELRPSDVCGRVGGDEFMLAITRSGVEETKYIVDRLRTRIAAMEFGPADESLTLSAGISEFPRHSLSQDELMHLADGAMYWAKSHGRNRTFVYSSETDLALSAQDAADRVARQGLVNTVHALAKAVDAKDGYTASHSQRVARYAAQLAAEMGFDAERVEHVRTAGVLHDVGKIGISDVLLLQPGKLSEEQFDVMRRHSELGRDIIAGAGMDQIGHYVLHLHERFDGRGYPAGIAGETIPLESRILHVADALEAMTSSRVYRKALPAETALEELEKHAGTQFDPEVATLIVKLVRSGELEIGTSEEQAELDTLCLRTSLEDASCESNGVETNGAHAASNGVAANGSGASANGHPARAASGGVALRGSGAGPAENGVAIHGNGTAPSANGAHANGGRAAVAVNGSSPNPDATGAQDSATGVGGAGPGAS